MTTPDTSRHIDHYRPEIDGLRALAVLPVMLFHAGFGLLPGGYLGVDVFFVISGYLITSILLRDLQAGRYSIAKFYERRARRILPALLLVIAVSIPFACALMLQGSTAHYLTHSAFALQPGHACLVHAGAGGVGQLLIQLAKARGATVYTTVGSQDKAGIARARGADAAILYRHVDFRDEIMRLTGNAGVDVVYDSVGRDTIHRSIRCLRRRGLCVMFGASSGQVDAMFVAGRPPDAAVIMVGANDVTGLHGVGPSARRVARRCADCEPAARWW